MLGQLPFHELHVRLHEIHLVDGDDDGHLGLLGVVDGLDGLRHDPVHRRDDKHHDIGHLRPACAHHGERLVARRVQENDSPLGLPLRRGREVDAIGTDVLRDPAVLALGDVRAADGVQELCLAMVDMTHDRDDGRPRGQVFLVLRVLLDDRLVVEGDDIHLAVVFRSKERCGVRVDLLVDRQHHPHCHELVDEVGPLEVHLLGQVCNGDPLGDGNLLGHRVGHDHGLFLYLQILLFRLIVLALRVLDLLLCLGEELLGWRLLVLGSRTTVLRFPSAQAAASRGAGVRSRTVRQDHGIDPAGDQVIQQAAAAAASGASFRAPIRARKAADRAFDPGKRSASFRWYPSVRLGGRCARCCRRRRRTGGSSWTGAWAAAGATRGRAGWTCGCAGSVRRPRGRPVT